MTDHPIIPPRELVQEWIAEIWHEGTPVQVAHSDLHIATRAAQWGADEELESCINWISVYQGLEHPELLIELLRSDRRPKPPSLKKQALHALGSPTMAGESRLIEHRDHDLLRRALEALPE